MRASLPQTLTSYSPCFRKEVGAHGIEERGVYRIHQFEKQEMIVVCKPEESTEWFDKLWQNTVDFFRTLDIPVRTMECCSGDLADLKVQAAWMWRPGPPASKKYFEVGSCSNLGDAQARRLGIRVRRKRRQLLPPHPEQHRGGPAPHAHRLFGKQSAGRWQCEDPASTAALYGRPGGHPSQSMI